jgi:hypothetical protein
MNSVRYAAAAVADYFGNQFDDQVDVTLKQINNFFNK